MLVPLSKAMASIDNAVANMGLCCGSVFAVPSDGAVDVPLLLDNLKKAVKRVVDKWSILRGQPIWLEEDNIWAINVPEEVSTLEKPFLFTSAVNQARYSGTLALATSSVSLSPSSPSGFQVQPDITFFRHGRLPSTFAAYADSGASLLAVHVTVFPDAIAVGLAAPHGLFDATGLGYAVRAINAELRGEPWTAPGFKPVNGLDQVLAELDQQGAGDPAAAPGGLSGWVPALSPSPVLKFLANYVHEKLWHQDEKGYVFLSSRAVDGLVRSVKDEVVRITAGREWVSKGDVLTAWVLKNAHAGELDARACVAGSAVYTLRALLPLAHYPHNAMIPYPMTRQPIPSHTLSSLSIAQLALMHRQSLCDSRTIPFVKTTLGIMQDTPLIPEHSWPWAGLRRNGPHPPFRWIASNQMSSGVADLKIPASACTSSGEEGRTPAVLDTLAFYMVVTTAIKDHQVFRFQENDLGIFLEGSMRRRRWRNIARAVKSLDEEYGITQ